MGKMERAILVGCQFPDIDDERFHYSLAELASLTETARGVAVLTVTQKREKPHPATYIGKGKILELKQAIAETDADVVIFNSELSPTQLKNLTNELKIKIIDRTQLILDIFAQRAKSREGKLQVELAQLEYLLPRLSGQGTELSRLGGGIGQEDPGKPNWRRTGAISGNEFTISKNNWMSSSSIATCTANEGKSASHSDRTRGLYERREINAV